MTTKSRIKSGSKADSKPHLVAFHELFHFANRSDYVLIFVGLVMTLLKALVHPFAIVAYSELVAMLIERNQSTGTSTETYALPLFGGGKLLINATHEENMAELKKDSISFGILITLDSLLLFISGTVYADIFNHVALQQVLRMRRKFFESTVRQDLTWHDLAQDQNFAVYITDNMEKIRNGIAENVGHFLQLVIDVVICVIVSFVYGWKLTLALFIYLPITVAINVTVAKYQSKLTTREQNSYARAGSVAEEVIGAIRTVVAFGGEEKESQRYDERLVPACKAGKIKGAFSGLSDSVLKSMVFICSAGAFWYGVHLVLEDREKEDTEKEYTPAVLIIVVSSIIVGADHLARVTPFLESFAMARGSAAPIFDAIDAKSRIDPSSKDGKILNYGLRGSIEFKDVFFSYPSRSDAIVLRGVSLCVGAGQTVALVGYSGSGKSTCVQLLQRFYDPMFGRILLDGLDIRQYNVQWLRSNIAVVGQEPVLFQGTIAQNIRYGKRNATRKEVEDASREAGAHDFIIALPNSYDTQISEKGTQLSGGQRQRIVIARAFIQNPKILLLDEATSALDYHSEKLVQEALDRASVGRTTIVVSHRLSAIRQANYIIFMDKGKVVEQGNHEELMLHAGKYYQMVTAHQYEDNFDDKLEDLEPLDKSTPQAQDAGDKGTSELSIKLRSSLDAKSSVASSDIKNFVMAKTAAAEEKERRMQTIYSKTFLRLMRSARPEWTYLTVGAVCAAIYGCTQPAFAIVCSEFYAALAQEDPETVLDRTALISIISVVIGISVGVACYTQTYLFNLAGVWLTTRMRSIIFKTIMKQEMAWFDEEENSVGALSARLSGDASSLQGAIGFPLSSIIQAITNFVCGVSIAFSYSWELALICLCTSPFMVASVVFEARFVAKAAVREKEVLEETSRIATEAIAQIRTVASLCREPWLIEEYNEETERYRVEIKKRLRFRGIVNNLGMAIMFFGYAVTLAYGGIMCAEGRIKFQDIMKISSTLLYGLFILAQSLTSTPAFNAALISGHRLHQIIDRQPRITSSNVYETLRVLPRTNTYPRSVSYHSLHFRYPTRPEQRVLCGLNLDVSQGKTVALVGASGCGKSTCIQLLQRFYDPDSGNIFIDQRNINRDMELPALRRRLGIVSQEPSLFDKTIAENIAYGDTSRAVPMTEIVEAAKMANAHDFIAALPLGYDTSLGARGTQLSGGQKQRIAIARALVRNPKILLLDEATSALDLQSERLVQSALDVACSGRTCIVIAHRLSTVQNADVICVLQNGRIVEQGSHSQLLATNGVYAKLYRSQPNIK